MYAAAPKKNSRGDTKFCIWRKYTSILQPRVPQNCSIAKDGCCESRKIGEHWSNTSIHTKMFNYLSYHKGGCQEYKPLLLNSPDNVQVFIKYEKNGINSCSDNNWFFKVVRRRPLRSKSVSTSAPKVVAFFATSAHLKF